MASVEQLTAAQPVIKDVETLKANLKEEKRARAESEVATTEDVKDGSAPGLTDDQQTKVDGEPRKRRKVGDAPDSQADVREITDLADHPEEPILDGPIPPSKQSPKKANPVPAKESSQVSAEDTASAKAVPESSVLEGEIPEEIAPKIAQEPPASNGKVNGHEESAPESVELTEKAQEVESAQSQTDA